MKDKHDRRTTDLLQSGDARRQASYADRQRAKGLRPLKRWVTADEAAKIDAFLEEIRGTKT